MHPEVEIVAEDLSDVAYLRQLHLSGFELFYGVGLPRQQLIFVNSGRGFVLEDGSEAVGVKSLPSKVLRTSILGFSGVGSAMWFRLSVWSRKVIRNKACSA